MNIKRLSVPAILVFLLCAAAAAAQATKQAPSRQTQVRANLLVLGEGDQVAGDIRRSDIHVFEDGIEQKVDHFAVNEAGVSVAMVFDNTGSVRPQIDQIISMGTRLVAGLGTRDEALVVRFSGREQIDVLQPWTADKARLGKAVESMYAGPGQSAIVDALYLTTQEVIKRGSRQKRQAIVLVTDGEDANSYYKLKDVFALLENTGIQVFIVTLTNEAQASMSTNRLPVTAAESRVEKFVGTIAARTGGTAYFLDKNHPDESGNNALEALATELRSQYVVGYTSASTDGKPRKLRVEIADGATGEKRKGVIKASVLVPE